MKVTENYLAKKIVVPPPPEPEEGEEAPPPQPEPVLDTSLLKKAVDIAHRTTRVPGSSTTLVLGLEPSNSTLVALNIGDCKFALFRDGKELFTCRAMQHTFDMPY